MLLYAAEGRAAKLTAWEGNVCGADSRPPAVGDKGRLHLTATCRMKPNDIAHEQGMLIWAAPEGADNVCQPKIEHQKN